MALCTQVRGCGRADEAARAAQAINIVQSTLDFIVNLFVMLYLLFFLLRDGEELLRRIKAAIPLRADQQRALFAKFAVVIRATVKGGVVVALLQGALGGLIFWFLEIRPALLWAALMAIFALLPVVGTGLPVAIYLLATGAIWQGVVLALYGALVISLDGALVISLVDNILRPILIGKDTRIPDYVVLIATLGGIAIFGANPCRANDCRNVHRRMGHFFRHRGRRQQRVAGGREAIGS